MHVGHPFHVLCVSGCLSCTKLTDKRCWACGHREEMAAALQELGLEGLDSYKYRKNKAIKAFLNVCAAACLPPCPCLPRSFATVA